MGWRGIHEIHRVGWVMGGGVGVGFMKYTV